MAENHLFHILDRQILPWISADGLSRFVYTSNSLQEFRRQDVPPAISTSLKPRRGKKISSRGPRHYGNVSARVAHWPDDNQDVLRYPTLACVLNGCADFHVADYVIHCPERHFVLFRAGVPSPGNAPNRPHFEGKHTGRICDVAWISPRMGSEGGLAFWTCRSEEDQHSNNLLSSAALVHQAALSTVFNLFVQSIDDQMDEGRHITTQALLLSLHLLRHGMQNDSLLQPAVPPGENSSSFEIAQRYMREHLNQPLTIDQVAQAVFMSRSTFTRQFRQSTGQSFHRYLSSLRLQQAKVLLAEDRWSVKSIARMVGLHPSQLRNLFLREEGLSPTAFRAKAADRSHHPHGSLRIMT